MSVIPQVCNFKDHYKGSTFSPRHIKFNFDITGCIILCQIRKQATYPHVHEWKTGINITVIDLLTGEIVLEQINEFNPQIGTYEYDLQITFPDGTNQTYMKGTVFVIQDISKLV